MIRQLIARLGPGAHPGHLRDIRGCSRAIVQIWHVAAVRGVNGFRATTPQWPTDRRLMLSGAPDVGHRGLAYRSSESRYLSHEREKPAREAGEAALTGLAGGTEDCLGVAARAGVSRPEAG